jgi:hypothetical protein
LLHHYALPCASHALASVEKEQHPVQAQRIVLLVQVYVGSLDGRECAVKHIKFRVAPDAYGNE